MVEAQTGCDFRYSIELLQYPEWDGHFMPEAWNSSVQATCEMYGYGEAHMGSEAHKMPEIEGNDANEK